MFRVWLFNYIRTQLNVVPTIAEEGVIVVTTDPKSTVLFSCHVDTVHNSDESEAAKPQALLYDPNFCHLYLDPDTAKGAPGSCLGGDDGVGIYIMLMMIRRKVPGTYVFHTGEECGGVGARAYVSKNRTMLGERFEQVVAFDRPVKDGTNPEVIITQGGRKCASQTYGKALAAELNKFPFEFPYVVSERGVFTDSKIYADDVPECVNLGCFYQNQHTSKEVVDCFGVALLLEAACRIDWAKLPIERKAEPDNYSSGGWKGGGRNGYVGGYGGQGGYGGYDNWDERQLASERRAAAQGVDTTPKQTPFTLGKKKNKNSDAGSNKNMFDRLLEFSYQELIDFVEENPETAAAALLTLAAKHKASEIEVRLLHRALGMQ